jgi:DNA-binding protein HU-beta
MTKQELVEQIADRAGLTKSQAGEALSAVLDSIEHGLARGEEISITGFGKFSVKARDAREGINPATGEKIQIAASKTPRFSAGARLKDAVNS